MTVAGIIGLGVVCKGLVGMETSALERGDNCGCSKPLHWIGREREDLRRKKQEKKKQKRKISSSGIASFDYRMSSTDESSVKLSQGQTTEYYTLIGLNILE